MQLHEPRATARDVQLHVYLHELTARISARAVSGEGASGLGKRKADEISADDGDVAAARSNVAPADDSALASSAPGATAGWTVGWAIKQPTQAGILPDKDAKSRSWIGTYWPPKDNVEKKELIYPFTALGSKVKHLIGQWEFGDGKRAAFKAQIKDATDVEPEVYHQSPHFQFVVTFHQPVRIVSAKAELGGKLGWVNLYERTYLEPVHSINGAINYVTKEEKRLPGTNVNEFGDRGTQGVATQVSGPEQLHNILSAKGSFLRDNKGWVMGNKPPAAPKMVGGEKNLTDKEINDMIDKALADGTVERNNSTEQWFIC